MRRIVNIALAGAMLVGAVATACAEDVLKVAVPQRGSWDAGIPELGQRGGIYAKHGLRLEILYTSAGPESIQALIAGSVDIATASGVAAAFGTFAKGAPIRIMSSEIVGAPDLYWFVPAASPIKTMTGQVDVGFGAVPYGLDMVADGRIRIIAGGNDVAALRSRSARVNLTNVATL